MTGESELRELNEGKKGTKERDSKQVGSWPVACPPLSPFQPSLSLPFLLSLSLSIFSVPLSESVNSFSLFCLWPVYSFTITGNFFYSTKTRLTDIQSFSLFPLSFFFALYSSERGTNKADQLETQNEKIIHSSSSSFPTAFESIGFDSETSILRPFSFKFNTIQARLILSLSLSFSFSLSFPVVFAAA